MITLINDGAVIRLVGVDGTADEGIDYALQKVDIESVLRDNEDYGVILAMVSSLTYELRAWNTQTESGTIYTDPELLYQDIIGMISNQDGAASSLGNWDAIGNIPLLANNAMYTLPGDVQKQAAPGEFFYVANADNDIPANNTELDGERGWRIGDMVKSDGLVWFRVPFENRVMLATNVIYDNSVTNFPDVGPGNPVDTTQEAIEAATAEFRGSINVHSDVDTLTNPPIIGDALSWDGAFWVPGVGGGGGGSMRLVDGVISTTIVPTVDGEYRVLEDISNPITAVAGDLVRKVGAVWQKTFDSATAGVGALQIQMFAASGDPANYIWDGSIWDALDAYEPAIGLENVNVSNPIGNITAAETGGSLRGVSISRIIDAMLFKAEYTKPLVPHITGGANINLERGSTLPTSLTYTFYKRGGGDMTDYDKKYYYGGSLVSSENVISSVLGTFSIVTIGGINVTFPNTIIGDTSIRVDAHYEAGPIPTDNIGNEYPQDQIQAGTTYETTTWTPRYPIWYGSTTEYFKVDKNSINEVTNILVTPNSGSITGGLTLDGDWVKNWSTTNTKALFTGNLTNKSLITVDGSAHALLVLPPGITINNIQEDVVGNWADLLLNVHYGVIDVDITAANNTEPRTYKCYYIRNLASNSLPKRTLRFSTQGTTTT